MMPSDMRSSWMQLLLFLWALTIQVQLGSSFQVISSASPLPRILLGSAKQEQAPSRAVVWPYNTNTAPPYSHLSYSKPRTSRTELFLSSEKKQEGEERGSSSLPFWLDPGTKGGVVFYTTLLIAVPLLLYNFVVGTGIADEISAGRWFGVGFTVVITLAWVSTYVFRVATKDMTYAKQLKDYENAVIAKRLEELDEDEIQALVEEVERDDF